MITDSDKKYLKRCVELAEAALKNGDEPFGTIIVSADGTILAEDQNRVGGGDQTEHPEFNLARWAANNLTPEERQRATVYTSGEHCPMCAAAHGWVGLGRIVYASSGKQLSEWMHDMGASPSRVKTLPIEDVISDTVVEGPVEEFALEIKALQRQSFERKQRS